LPRHLQRPNARKVSFQEKGEEKKKLQKMTKEQGLKFWGMRTKERSRNTGGIWEDEIGQNIPLEPCGEELSKEMTKLVPY